MPPDESDAAAVLHVSYSVRRSGASARWIRRKQGGKIVGSFSRRKRYRVSRSSNLIRLTGITLEDGHPFDGSFMALGDGRHKLAVTAAARRAIGKQVRDTVRVHLTARRS